MGADRSSCKCDPPGAGRRRRDFRAVGPGCWVAVGLPIFSLWFFLRLWGLGRLLTKGVQLLHDLEAFAMQGGSQMASS